MEKAFMVEFLRGPRRPTAVVCYFSVFVPAVLHAASTVGLNVPQDLSVVTFGAENLREHGLTVSAMLEPHYGMGQEAVRLLLHRITRPAREAPPPGSHITSDHPCCATSVARSHGEGECCGGRHAEEADEARGVDGGGVSGCDGALPIRAG
jgi:hypothetical protein